MPADVPVVVVELALDRDARLVRVAVPDDVPVDRASAGAVQGRVAEVDVIPLRDAPRAVAPEVHLGRGDAEQRFQVERGPDRDEPAPGDVQPRLRVERVPSRSSIARRASAAASRETGPWTLSAASAGALSARAAERELPRDFFMS